MDRCIIPYTNAMADKWMDCETCEAKISAKARSCPHCGHSYLRNYGPLRYFSEKQLWKYGAILFAMSSAAIGATIPLLYYSFNWEAAFVACLVFTGGPWGYLIYSIKFSEDLNLKRVFYLSIIGVFLWVMYMYLFFESKSS
jgi:ribosomal protein L40E